MRQVSNQIPRSFVGQLLGIGGSYYWTQHSKSEPRNGRCLIDVENTSALWLTAHWVQGLSIVHQVLQAATGTPDRWPVLRPRAQQPGSGVLVGELPSLANHALARIASSMEAGSLKL